jgi:hypothetical protein
LLPAVAVMSLLSIVALMLRAFVIVSLVMIWDWFILRFSPAVAVLLVDLPVVVVVSLIIPPLVVVVSFVVPAVFVMVEP